MSGAIMFIKDHILHASISDGPNNDNVQTGFFVMRTVEGPFKTKEDAENYMKANPS